MNAVVIELSIVALNDVGYRGPLSVEIEFQGDPWPPLAEVNASMTRACSHLNALGLG